MLIYVIKQISLNNEIVYVGQARNFNVRKARHIRDAKNSRDLAIAQAIRKYGEEDFIFEEIVKSDTQDQLNQFEIFCIAEHKPKYNRAPGGLNNITTKGQAPWNKGLKIPFTPEMRERFKPIWEANIGRKMPPKSEETLQRMRDARIGQDMSHRMKPIIHIETGIEYKSLREAADALNLQHSKVCLTLLGKRRHTGGCTFRYAGEEAIPYTGPTEEELIKKKEIDKEYYRRKVEKLKNKANL